MKFHLFYRQSRVGQQSSSDHSSFRRQWICTRILSALRDHDVWKCQDWPGIVLNVLKKVNAFHSALCVMYNQGEQIINVTRLGIPWELLLLSFCGFTRSVAENIENRISVLLLCRSKEIAGDNVNKQQHTRHQKLLEELSRLSSICSGKNLPTDAALPAEFIHQFTLWSWSRHLLLPV